MGYWGWRPLLCGVFISAWVVGCNIVPDNTDPSAAAPSSYPIVTLTVGRLPTVGLSPPPNQAAATVMVTAEPTPTATTAPAYYVVQSGETLEQIAARFAMSAELLREANPGVTLEAGARLVIPRPTPLPLDVQAPTCYETSTSNVLCLGRVDNPLAFPVESVTVEVSLMQADGTTALRRASVEVTVAPDISQTSPTSTSSRIACPPSESVMINLAGIEEASRGCRWITHFPSPSATPDIFWSPN